MHDYESAVARFGADVSLDKCKEIESVYTFKFGDSIDIPPILTIGIPVYNGYQEIYRTLTSVYSSIQQLADINCAEVIICDNASTDPTSEAIHSFFNGKKIRGGYFRHLANIGFDRNLDSIIKVANGKYVWFVGCGDEIKIDSLNRLVNKLSKIDVSNLLLDFDRFSEADATVIQKREHSNRSDLFINSRDDFSHPRYAPALSANVVNREKWASCLTTKFVTSGWGHVERILQTLALTVDSKTAILASPPFFTLFVDKKGWWTKPDGYKLHLEHIKVIRGMTNLGFKPKAARYRLHELNGVVLVRSVIGARKYGYSFSKKDLDEIRACCRVGAYPLIVLGLHFPLRLASFIFSESKRKALRLGFRKICKRIRSEN